MADFDQTNIEADWAAVCSVTYSGEAFRVAAVTYYGVFNITDAQYQFLDNGYSADKHVTLETNRTALTPTVDLTLFRVFDSTTYRVIKADPDMACWRCILVEPR